MRNSSFTQKFTSRYDCQAISPKHERVDYSRKIMRINQAIKSILSISHMERMSIIAINNRSICNHNKIKRAERAYHSISKKNELPNIKQLRLDNRRKILKTEPDASVNISNRISFMQDRIKDEQVQICEKYIQEYLQRLKKQNRFDILGDRTKLIEEACKQIFQKMQKKNSNKPTLRLVNRRQSSDIQIKSPRTSVNYRKARSITDVEYMQEMNRIRRSSQYENKIRQFNQKSFLRRIKKIKQKYHPM